MAGDGSTGTRGKCSARCSHRPGQGASEHQYVSCNFKHLNRFHCVYSIAQRAGSGAPDTGLRKNRQAQSGVACTQLLAGKIAINQSAFWSSPRKLPFSTRTKVSGPMLFFWNQPWGTSSTNSISCEADVIEVTSLGFMS